MKDISVNYLGLSLKSPFIAASSALTIDVASVKEMEAAGVGAVIVKSLFEEQINNEAGFVSDVSMEYPEMDDYIHSYIKDNSIREYTNKLKEIKDAVNIPVIASINCYSLGNWISFAKEIEATGVDGLEINIYDMPFTLKRSSEEIEKEYFEVIDGVVKAISIPVSVKIGDHFSNIPLFVSKLEAYGAKAVTMFNKFYTPDIDIEKREIVPSAPFSNEQDYLKGLRWTAIVSSLVRNINISASTGIHTPENAIKQILSGASTVQLCSVLYKRGIDVVKEFNDSLSSYLEKNGFDSVDQIRGILNYSNVKNPAKFERVQFMKTFGAYKK